MPVSCDLGTSFTVSVLPAAYEATYSIEVV